MDHLRRWDDIPGHTGDSAVDAAFFEDVFKDVTEFLDEVLQDDIPAGAVSRFITYVVRFLQIRLTSMEGSD